MYLDRGHWYGKDSGWYWKLRRPDEPGAPFTPLDLERYIKDRKELWGSTNSYRFFTNYESKHKAGTTRSYLNSQIPLAGKGKHAVKKNGNKIEQERVRRPSHDYDTHDTHEKKYDGRDILMVDKPYSLARAELVNLLREGRGTYADALEANAFGALGY